MRTGGFSMWRGKRILLLQGPLGPFFQRLGRDLEQAGAHVDKVNFNGGDWLFYPSGALSYRGRLSEWPDFLERLLAEKEIDILLLFGDCRPMHLLAHDVALRNGVEVRVFEEGYVRPDYVTLERWGVNGHSRIPRTPLVYLNAPPIETPATRPVGNTFWHTALWAVLYYLAAALLRWRFPRYEHHRPLTLREGWPWVRSAWRKQVYRFRERGAQDALAGAWAGKYFLVPLQVHNDAQVHVHSDFDSVEVFIEHVMHSFASHAPAGTLLVIKHHPMDRGYHDRTALIRMLARRFGIEGRVWYIHDQHLPTLLEHARGVVLVNSTVGMSSLHHGTPTKVCGNAVYDMKGLTFQGRLDDFWAAAPGQSVDRELYLRFRGYLIRHTQLNGSFYRRLKADGSHAGLLGSGPVDTVEDAGARSAAPGLPRKAS